MMALIKTSIGTKFSFRWSDLMCSLALKAVRTVSVTAEDEAPTDSAGIKTVDIKRYARVEKIPGGEIEDCRVLNGVMVNKDVTHPKMRRRIVNPRVVLLDCPLEYKKGESQTNIEVTKEEDWNKILLLEEEQIKAMCDKIIEFKPDIVFTEKGVSGMCFYLDPMQPFSDPFCCRRLGPALLFEGQPTNHCHSTSSKDRQQPYSASRGRHHCQQDRRP